MIGYIQGTVLHTAKNNLVIDVSGVGYVVHVSNDVIERNGEGSSIELWTHLSVKETSLDLFGFDTRDELHFFELLIGISGIGPKGALGILSIATIETLIAAISSGDTSYLTKVSGIGKKSAQKIVLELKDKLGNFETGTTEALQQEELDALDALKALGYSGLEARNALKQIPATTTGMQDKIREALKLLGQ